jgi:hypothetical protein
MFILAASLLLAWVNAMLFAAATRLQVAPITRSGLVANTIAAAAAWLVLLKGNRGGLLWRIAGLLLFAAIHHILISNIIAVAVYGL